MNYKPSNDFVALTLKYRTLTWNLYRINQYTNYDRYELDMLEQNIKQTVLTKNSYEKETNEMKCEIEMLKEQYDSFSQQRDKEIEV